MKIKFDKQTGMRQKPKSALEQGASIAHSWNWPHQGHGDIWWCYLKYNIQAFSRINPHPTMPRIHIRGKGASSQHLRPWVAEILLIWKNISHENSHNKIPHLWSANDFTKMNILFIVKMFYSSMYRSWLDVHYRSPFFSSTSCISTNIIYLNFPQRCNFKPEFILPIFVIDQCNDQQLNSITVCK